MRELRERQYALCDRQVLLAAPQRWVTNTQYTCCAIQLHKVAIVTETMETVQQDVSVVVVKLDIQSLDR